MPAEGFQLPSGDYVAVGDVVRVTLEPPCRGLRFEVSASGRPTHSPRVSTLLFGRSGKPSFNPPYGAWLTTEVTTETNAVRIVEARVPGTEPGDGGQGPAGTWQSPSDHARVGTSVYIIESVQDGLLLSLSRHAGGALPRSGEGRCQLQVHRMPQRLSSLRPLSFLVSSRSKAFANFWTSDAESAGGPPLTNPPDLRSCMKSRNDSFSFTFAAV